MSTPISRAKARLSAALARARGEDLSFDPPRLRRKALALSRFGFAGYPVSRIADEALLLRSSLREVTGEAISEATDRAIALAAAAAPLVLGLEPRVEQLMAALAMSEGRLAELATGEGKTLSAALCACAWAMEGSVHVLTANEYLAARDAEWMGPLYRALGLSCAAVKGSSPEAERAGAYAGDLAYLTARQAGFDYLRDGLRYRKEAIVSPPFRAAIVDEADSILIDEARVPLVIAGIAGGGDGDFSASAADRAVAALVPGKDYIVDAREGRVSLSLGGIERLGAMAGIGGPHEEAYREAYARANVALRARCLLQRGRDYVVREGRVEVVDEFTGRIAPDRAWPDGIQAALEAKEGLVPRPEGEVYGSIAVQHLIGLYGTLAAMTATAVSQAPELGKAYGLGVVAIPPFRPSLRVDEPDCLFPTKEEKLSAIVEAVSSARRAGRPVLVGTGSVLESEELSRALLAAAIPHEVLNASNDALEAGIVAGAGRRGAVTVSTNMAGRGTDIRLGGGDPDEAREVAALGGLLVIGTGRHESRRVDDQLRGRAGRQGDPGSSRFYASLEDELFLRFGVAEFLPAAYREGLARGRIGDSAVARELERAQSIITAKRGDQRRLLRLRSAMLEYDRRHERAIREAALMEGALPDDLCNYLRDGAGEDGRLAERLSGARAADWDAALTKVFLRTLDLAWAEHLAQVDEIREGIQLCRYGGGDPDREFLERAGGAYEAMIQALPERTVRAFLELDSPEDAEDPGRAGMALPEETWTYQLEEASLPDFSVGALSAAQSALAFFAGPVYILLGLAKALFGKGGAARPSSRRR